MTTMKAFILCGLFAVIKGYCSNGDADRNGNGAVTESEMLKYFEIVDTNKDEKWSTMEYGHVETVDEMSSLCRKIFQELDKMDGVEDNSVIKSSVLALFNALDQDGKHYLSEVLVLALFKALDQDGDGIIIPPEQYPGIMKRKDIDILSMTLNFNERREGNTRVERTMGQKSLFGGPRVPPAATTH